MKKKKQPRGPRGMVKRTTFIKAGPALPPPAPGDIVWYPDNKEAWQTGRFIRVIDRGRDWGKCIVIDSVTGGERHVKAEHVRAIEGG